MIEGMDKLRVLSVSRYLVVRAKTKFIIWCVLILPTLQIRHNMIDLIFPE